MDPTFYNITDRKYKATSQGEVIFQLVIFYIIQVGFSTAVKYSISLNIYSQSILSLPVM